MGQVQSKLANRFEASSRQLASENAALWRRESDSSASNPLERYDVIVIGGGQAGLAVGYHLARRGLRFLILDASEHIGDSWRKRWDSLRLFTPAGYDGLDGMPFPASSDSFPTKDEMADYLAAYVERFNLPVLSGIRVNHLFKRDGRYRVTLDTRELQADQVVVAMSNHQEPSLPEFANQLRADIVQLHSSEYRNPSVLRPGGVLIVGAGNSGSEIAIELARSHTTWMAGRDTGHVPFRIDGFWGRHLLVHFVLRLVFHYVLTVRTPVGRKMRPRLSSSGAPLIRVRPKDLERASIRRVPRLAGVKAGLPMLTNGQVLDVKNVIWCTGYSANFSWIDLPVLDRRGEPIHVGGIVPGEPGLYFVGLHFLYAMSSAMIHGVGRDAARVVEHVARNAQMPVIQRLETTTR